MRLTVCMFGITVLDVSIVPNDAASNDDVADVLATGTTFGFYSDCRYDVVPGGETQPWE